MRLRFADSRAAKLAAALFRQARELRPAGADGVVATLDSGVAISVAASPSGALLTNERTKAQLLPPLDSGADLSKIIFSPDGRLVATTFTSNERSLVRVWDSTTGLPLSERLWHEGIVSDYAFTADSTRLLTASRYGVLRSWFFQDFKGGVPGWMTRMGEALSGLRVVGGVDVQRLSAEEHARSRREFEAALARAAGAGDAAARFLLNTLRR